MVGVISSNQNKTNNKITSKIRGKPPGAFPWSSDHAFLFTEIGTFLLTENDTILITDFDTYLFSGYMRYIITLITVKMVKMKTNGAIEIGLISSNAIGNNIGSKP